MLCVRDLRLLTQSNSALLGWSAFFWVTSISRWLSSEVLIFSSGKDTSALYLVSPNYLVLNNPQAFFFKQFSRISQSIWNSALWPFCSPMLQPSYRCHHLCQCQPLLHPSALLFSPLIGCPAVLIWWDTSSWPDKPKVVWWLWSSVALRGPQTFVLSSHSSSNLCLWTRGIRPGLIFITTPPWPPPHHHSNHHCALSLSGADTWPAPDGHWPAWPLSPAALNWNHRWALPLPALNWHTSCCDLVEEKKIGNMMIMFQLNHLKGQFCFVPCCALYGDLWVQGLKLLD